MKTVLSPELGDLIEVHRPMRGYTGWIPILIAPTFFLFQGILVGGNEGIWVGLAVFFGLGIPLMLVGGEWFLLEHRFYQHGMVFRSLLPGLSSYLVPYYSCDPDTFHTVGRRAHDGTDIVNRRYRQCPLTKTNILIRGIHPHDAYLSGPGRDKWEKRNVDIDYTTWMFSSRTPEHHIALLTELITTSNQTYPPRRETPPQWPQDYVPRPATKSP